MQFSTPGDWALMPHIAFGMLLSVLIWSNWTTRRLPGRLPLLAVEASICLWNIGRVLQPLALDLPAARLALAVGDGGAYLLGPSGFWLASHLSGRRPRHPAWWGLALFGLPLWAMAATLAGLPSVQRWVGAPDGSGEIPSQPGPLFLPLMLQFNLLAAGALLLSFGEIRRGQHAQRMRALTLSVSVAAPWALFSIIRYGLLPLPHGVVPIVCGFLAAVVHGVDRYYTGIAISPLARDLVIESMPDGMLVSSPDGLLADYNPAAARLLWLNRGQLGQPVRPLVESLRRAPGPPQVEISEVPLVKGGEEVGTVHLLRDVTESRRIERELREASESAQRAARVQSEFLANMSHEIRTPLTGILGLSRLMAAETGPPEASQRRYAAIVRDSAETLQNITDDILDLSKIEAGLMRIAPQPVQVALLVEETVELYQETARRQQLELRFAVARDFPAWVLADGLRIRQLLRNLVSNAIKFTSSGSVDIALAHGSGYWSLTVTDTGIGFDPAVAESLFERFIQADASLARRFGGTGLGLPISKKLVELMGGEIGASSQPGQGAQFWFRIPLQVASSPDDTVAMTSRGGDAGAGLAGTRVLIAEDSPVIQTLMSALLRRLGCQTTVAADGDQAVRLALEGGWDLILMDCMMPGTDGYAATRRIRQDEASNGRGRIPIVACSASVLAADRERCQAAGMDGFIAKPVDPATLERVVVQHRLRGAMKLAAQS
ncbi:MAG: response regulator [Bryobacterales bacterium]|nr:response regulator [Bryobacterales bacterium]